MRPTSALLGLLAIGACRPPPDQPVERATQACCSWANETLTEFRGCTVRRGSCKSYKGEKWWMRGAVTCGPVDEATCDGGRCCRYAQQYDPDVGTPIEDWAPPGFPEPPGGDRPPQPEPEPEPAQPLELPPPPIGVATCDAYVTAYFRCSESMPPQERAAVRDDLRASVETWRTIASEPGGREALAATCEQALSLMPAACRP